MIDWNLCALVGLLLWMLSKQIKKKSLKDYDNSRSKKDARKEKHKLDSEQANLAANYTCPITLELFQDPVVAMDEKIYERSAIEKYFQEQRKAGLTIKSPLTNKPMGRKLKPSPRTERMIAVLIHQNAIAGDLAEGWKQKAEEERRKEKLLEKAEAGNVSAMEKVADCYFLGEEGFEQDPEQAFLWYDRARVAGSITALIEVAELLLEGPPWCFKRNETKGVLYMCMAASKGSDYAADYMGYMFSKGAYGVPKDKDEAIYWYTEATKENSLYRTLSAADKAQARKKLEELKA